MSSIDTVFCSPQHMVGYHFTNGFAAVSINAKIASILHMTRSGGACRVKLFKYCTPRSQSMLFTKHHKSVLTHKERTIEDLYGYGCTIRLTNGDLYIMRSIFAVTAS